MSSKLILHCGGKEVPFSEVKLVQTPAATATHYPIPHAEYVQLCVDMMRQYGFKVTGEQHALDKEGQRYFGILRVAHENPKSEYGYAVGLRNAHDKSVSARVAFGTNVFVCDNLAFSGEINIQRKHTRFAQEQLPALCSRAIGRLGDYYKFENERVNAYKNCAVNDQEAQSFAMRLGINGVVPGRDLMDIWQYWDKPEHADFKDRTLWSFFNAVTEAAKRITSPGTFVQRTQGLYGFCDSVAGIHPPQALLRDLAAN